MSEPEKVLVITVAYSGVHNFDIGALYADILQAFRDNGIEPECYEARMEMPFSAERHFRPLEVATTDGEFGIIGIWKAGVAEPLPAGTKVTVPAS